MTDYLWLIHPLITAIFFTLGFVLFHQFLLHTLEKQRKATRLKNDSGISKVVTWFNVVFFVLTAIGLSAGTIYNHDEVAFINFWLVAIFYAVLSAGQPGGLSILIILSASTFLFLGFSPVTVVTISLSTVLVVCVICVLYLVVCALTYMMKKCSSHEYLPLVLSAMFGGVFWWIAVLLPPSILDVTPHEGLFYFASFLVMFVVIYFAARWKNHEANLIALMHREAVTDKLTNLSNYNAFEQDFPVLYRHYYSTKNNLSMVEIDVDFFKAFNDSFGHLAGNQMLAKIGGTIKTTTSTFKGATSYRTGGEEFVVLLPDLDLQAAVGFTEVLRSKINTTALNLNDGDPLTITASYGVAQLRKQDLTAKDFFSRADATLYRAKDEGRNRITIEERLFAQ